MENTEPVFYTRFLRGIGRFSNALSGGCAEPRSRDILFLVRGFVYPPEEGIKIPYFL